MLYPTINPNLPPSDEEGGAPKGAPEREILLNKNPYFNTRYVVIQREAARPSEESHALAVGGAFATCSGV